MEINGHAWKRHSLSPSYIYIEMFLLCPEIEILRSLHFFVLVAVFFSIITVMVIILASDPTSYFVPSLPAFLEREVHFTLSILIMMELWFHIVVPSNTNSYWNNVCHRFNHLPDLLAACRIDCR